MAEAMSKGLMKDVFDDNTKQAIDCIRTVLDLETMAIQVKLSGAPHVGALRTVQFIQNARKLVPKLDNVSDQELRIQFNSFLRKLEDHVEDIDEDDLRSLSILKDFLSTKLGLFRDIEMILHIMCCGATSLSVESVVESWISVYEAHSNKHRPISNDRAEMEVVVAVDGPKLQHADSVIKKSLRLMFSTSKSVADRGGHFVRRSENIKDYSVSKVVDGFASVVKKTPFME